MLRSLQLFLPMVYLLGLLACGGPDWTQYTGPEYPPTKMIATTFQPNQVGPSCKVFAELLVRLPADLSGKEIRDIILSEAGARGANQVMIGQARTSEDDDGVEFLYYGPEQEYPCPLEWHGWKFGYALWEKQKEWVNLGYNEWGSTDTRFDRPLVVQAVFLRCAANAP